MKTLAKVLQWRKSLIQAQGFNEGKGKPFTWQDAPVHGPKDGRTLYVFLMGRPEPGQELTLQALQLAREPNAVSLLGYKGQISRRMDNQGRLILVWPKMPQTRPTDEYACVFKISGFDLKTKE